MKYLIGNWKANHDVNSTREWLSEWREFLTQDGDLSEEILVAVAPPAVLYPIFLAKAKELGLPILAALQNISEYESGPHTGEIVLKNLADMMPSLCIVGHSERRREAGETDEMVAQKVARLIAAQVVPVLCFDEPYLESLAAAIDPEYYSRIILAYEAPSAISDGKVLAPGQAKNMAVDLVLPVLERARKAFPGAKILYGGSVSDANVGDYVTICDGVLVGGASLEAHRFYQSAKQLESAHEKSNSAN